MTNAFRPTIIPFTKANACGNDFLIIDGMHAPADLAAFSRRVCDRHAGVGADGVEWLFPAPDANIRARLFNADGSEAEISGNGTRCVAAYLCAEQAKDKLVIRTGAGLKTCVLTARNESSFEFEIAMGEPRVGDEFSIKLAFGEVRGFRCRWGIRILLFSWRSSGRGGRERQRRWGGTMTSSMGLTLNWCG